eukprot:TRINITY_DN1579_c0_g1_i1.p1 TRINITY_DN1579_c0_g1~~TRINITY_DN1579_c0_g1_i1.p1  ORF type:complete len:736 (-),score=131.38 TRINITY_DN1579_c0_g1_i1:310-2517(-)
MQGQRSTVDSLPESFEFDHGSSSGNSGVEQLYWNNMLNPVDTRNLPDYLLSPGDSSIAYVNAGSHDGGSLNGWNLGGPSSSEFTLNPAGHDEAKMEHGWTASLASHSGAEEERQFEPTSFLSLESVNINLNSSHVANEPLLLQSSNSNDIPQNANLNAGYVGNGDQVTDTSVCPHPYRPAGLENEQIPSAGSSTGLCVTSSGSGGYMVDDGDGRPGCSLDGQRLSCKRKSYEGVSGQSSLGGSQSLFHRAENSAWHTASARHNGGSSLSISSPPEHLSGVNLPEEQLNLRFGNDMRGLASDSLPALSVAGNAETSQRNFRIRINPAHQQDSVPPNTWSMVNNAIRHPHVLSPHQSVSGLLPFNQPPLNSRPAAASTSSHQSHPPVPRIPTLPRNVHTFPYNGSPNARVGSSSNSPVISGERAAAFREQANSISTSRSIPEQSMFGPATELRHLAQDSTNWSLNSGMGIPGNIASTSRIGSSSGAHLSPASTWVPHQNLPTQYPRRLSEVVRRSFVPSSSSESGGQSSNFPPLRSGPASSQEIGLPSGAGHQGHQHPYLRSGIWMDRQGDGVLGVPLSLRSLAAASEGRSRLVSEIRNVLDLMRRGENLRFEDVLILDPSVFYGGADLQDRHRDMRLDVDNMSYEELLALEERIGNVSTGLSEDTVLKCLKQWNFLSIAIGASLEVEPCCICQEEYVDGEELGTLDCGHDFHTNCIKQWLMHKNLCPICKTTALVT